MTGLTIVTVDPQDDAALREWHAVEAASVRHERPYALQRSLAALTAAVRHPNPYARRVLLAGMAGGVLVGVADLTLPSADNTHLVELEINVHPDHRRHGVGAALHDAADALRRAEGRTTVLGEMYLQIDGAAAGLDFATMMGFTSVHTEEHLAMRLPADPFTVDALTRQVPGYEVVTWQGRCPDEHRAAYVAMRNQMNADVPTGEADAAPVVYDEERLSVSETRLARSYEVLVSAVRRVTDGEMGGYSLVFLDRGDDVALQDDTLVMPDHRGQGLGMQLKLANLAVLRAEHPDRTMLHTWTDPDNGAMYRTNVNLGFAPVEIMHEVQRVD
ncbi:GNAT family N-acetyltransferase [soil metagenome]